MTLQDCRVAFEFEGFKKDAGGGVIAQEAFCPREHLWFASLHIDFHHVRGPTCQFRLVIEADGRDSNSALAA